MAENRIMTDAERELLCLYSSYFIGNAPEKEKGEISISDLMKLSEIHKITPIIYSASKKHHRSYTKDEAITIMKGTAIRQVAFQTRRSEEFLKLYKELSDRGITALCVKGIIIRNIYPDSDYRASSDEDILVKKEDFDALRTFFLEKGFKEDDSLDDGSVHTFTSADSSLRIEAHTSLFPESPDYNKRLNEMFKDAFLNPEKHFIGDIWVYSLSHTLHLLYLLLHSLKHFIHCGFGIRQVSDFALYAQCFKEGIDSHFIVKATDTISATTFLGGMLYACEKCVGKSPSTLGFDPSLVERADFSELISDIISSGVYGNSSTERAHSATVTLYSVYGKKHGFLYALFPSYDSLKDKYPFLNNRKHLLPVAWVKRIFSYIFNKKGSVTSSSSETISIGKKRLNMLKEYGLIK